MDRRPRVEPEYAPGVGERDEARRVEELLRINARLAAEVRSLMQGRAAVPRQSAMTSARRLGVLIDERDSLRERLEEAEALLGTVARLNEQCRVLERDRDALAAEVRRLRSGWRGFARRARARLARR